MASVKTSVTQLPESRVRVQAEVAAEEVERSVQQAARKLGREMRIPGFRKGKVPPPVVIRRLGRELVLDEALRGALGGWYVDAIDEAGISPVGDPDLDLPEKLPGQGEPLSFSIEIGVRPTAQLGQYRGLEVGRREPHVDEREIEAELERLRDRLATLETAERPAADGDFVVVDYLGRVDGEPFEGSEARDQLIELGSERLVPEFERQLLGARAGERREVQITFPEDYPGGLANKTAAFEVAVHEVKAKRLPALDDEFASEASEFDTLDELREDIAARLRERDERAIEREFEQAVLDAAVAEAKLELPERLVHARAHEIVEDTLSALARQGIDKDTYLRVVGKDEEALVHDAEPEAERALSREAVLAAIVRAEGISPSDEELREALKPAAADGKTTVEKLFAQLRSSGRLERMREELATRQALELIVREAKPISVEQARARQKLWTPGREPAAGEAAEGAGAGRLWTPGS
jgi:trigger factor